MSKVPRILPLVGVAIGGVIAANALSGAHAVPKLMSATQAMAEQALSAKPGKSADPLPPGASAALGQTPAAGAAQPGSTSAAPVCAPSPADLARAAGLSPAELQVLQSLQSRRSQIDGREKDLDTEVQLLAAAEAKLDAKLKSMNDLKADIQALMGQADQKTQAEVDRLVVVYSKMRPQDAAAVMAQLDDKVRLPIAAAMKPAVLSAVLGRMGTMEAKVLTEKLAHRFASAQALAQAANAPPGPTPAAQGPAPQGPVSQGYAVRGAAPAARAPGKAAQASAPALAPTLASAAYPATTDAAGAQPAAQSAATAAAPAAISARPARTHKPRRKVMAKAAKPKAASTEAKADDASAPAKPQPALQSKIPTDAKSS